MTTPSRVHRASAQRRRAALLDAAEQLVAEVGAGAVTHRAVAARAGVPLSTTSYFFSSIDELVTEALRQSAQGRVTDFDDAERVWVRSEGQPVEDMISGLVDQLMTVSTLTEGGHVEAYLAAGRQPELQKEVSVLLKRLMSRSEWQLERGGAIRAGEASWALQELVDGAMLHRLAGIDTDHRDRLTKGLRLLLAASMLTDEEVDGLLDRFHADARAGGGEPMGVSSAGTGG